MSSVPSAQSNDVELVLFNFIRKQFEQKYKENVPIALKYLMLQFSNRHIQCKLLSYKQDLAFFKLASTLPSKVRAFKSLFRASNHKRSGSKFHQYCDNKNRTITIIQAHSENIFVGYAYLSWYSYDGYNTNDNAFTVLFKYNKNSFDIIDEDENIHDNITKKVASIPKQSPYDSFEVNMEVQKYKCYQVYDYQVFQIHFIDS